MIGETVAERYRIEELLGTGGMSSVYLARDSVLERPVALKVLHEQFADDPEYVERFRREARAIARLAHPNIVTVIDRGEFGGRQYMVFEYVRGENLKQLLRRKGPLPVADALSVAHQVARGLAFAHEHGIVHRDVKPQNVLVDEEGGVKVTDFGLARAPELDEELTQSGALVGTADYLAPEGARAARVDERSDQYGLGVLLFELLTGELPFRGENVVQVALGHLHGPVPSLRDLRPDVPERVEAVAQRALQKEPEDRYPSVEALAAALEACLAGEPAVVAAAEGVTQILPPPTPVPRPPAAAPEAARAPRRSSRRRLRSLLPLLLGLLVLAGGGLAVALVVRGGEGVLPDVGLGGGEGEEGAQTVRLRALADYDPEGGDGEHPEAVAAATDGDPATFWRTETYSSFSKSGVGLVLDAGERVELASLVVRTDAPGFTALVRAGNRPGGGFEDVSGEQEVGRRTTFELEGGPYRYYVLWITDPNGRAHVNEVRARA